MSSTSARSPTSLPRSLSPRPESASNTLPLQGNGPRCARPPECTTNPYEPISATLPDADDLPHPVHHSHFRGDTMTLTGHSVFSSSLCATGSTYTASVADAKDDVFPPGMLRFGLPIDRGPGPVEQRRDDHGAGPHDGHENDPMIPDPSVFCDGVEPPTTTFVVAMDPGVVVSTTLPLHVASSLGLTGEVPSSDEICGFGGVAGRVLPSCAGSVVALPLHRGAATIAGGSVAARDDAVTHVPNRPLLLLTLALSVTGSFYAFDLPGQLNTQLEDRFGFDEDAWQGPFGRMYAMYALPNAVMPFLAGRMIDIHGARTIHMILLALVVAGQGLVALGIQWTSMEWLLLGRFLLGVGGESLSVSQTRITCDWFHERSLGFALGFHLALARLGSVMNDLLTPVIATRFGPSVAGMLALILCSISLVLGAFACLIDYHRAQSAHHVSSDDEEDVPVSLLRSASEARFRRPRHLSHRSRLQSFDSWASLRAPPSVSEGTPLLHASAVSPPVGSRRMSTLGLVSTVPGRHDDAGSTAGVEPWPVARDPAHGVPDLDAQTRHGWWLERTLSDAFGHATTSAEDPADYRSDEKPRPPATVVPSVMGSAIPIPASAYLVPDPPAAADGQWVLRSFPIEYWALALGMVSVYGTCNTVTSLASGFLQSKYGLAATEAGSMVALADTMATLVVPVSGYLFERMSHRQRQFALHANGVLLALVCLAFGHSEDRRFLLPALLGCGTAYAVGASMLWPLIPYIVHDPRTLSTAYGVVTCCVNGSLAMIPAGIAALIAQDSSYGLAMNALAALAVLGGVTVAVCFRQLH
ncbi:hypothetical protein AMAG_13116 [Allomyces macrogynus ATCC 38327]|uniref:Lysosomal dipeptide transporter MFSD1 n=1 Tax=Allomyces macrogynus (strain ATCC 38327) TaxID=578462 RepID=A0A0L0SZZ1_ALLM3|nr:hypothetical protein AMAG_13116 [Allomyces macrogynus ATCC 38327]|eukprot:KNE67929.1 hypothetical protein AMAG_13116 [Allomyces macrogynus ATCC 38327]